jgi:hypothetical protein
LTSSGKKSEKSLKQIGDLWQNPEPSYKNVTQIPDSGAKFWVRCYDLKNIFSPKNWRFLLKPLLVFEKNDHNIGF